MKSVAAAGVPTLWPAAHGWPFSPVTLTCTPAACSTVRLADVRKVSSRYTRLPMVVFAAGLSSRELTLAPAAATAVLLTPGARLTRVRFDCSADGVAKDAFSTLRT